LESVYRGNSIEGSNPSLSASLFAVNQVAVTIRTHGDSILSTSIEFASSQE
jgi:hypothetical protein